MTGASTFASLALFKLGERNYWMSERAGNNGVRLPGASEQRLFHIIGPRCAGNGNGDGVLGWPLGH